MKRLGLQGQLHQLLELLLRSLQLLLRDALKGEQLLLLDPKQV
jgi:hypothetical protein